MKVRATTMALSTLAMSVQAQRFSRQCFSDICFQLNIPQHTANSGNGDIFFQISGPTSYSWIGLGQGSQMSGSNIFVIYANGQGNVTLSPRHGAGHFEPQHDRTANVTLLEGSGISNGRMVANVLCANCERWQGGSTDFTGSSGDWIHASLPGSALDSTELNANIAMHQDHAPFTWDYSTAKGGNSANPFVAKEGSSATTGVSPAPTASSSSTGNGNGDSGGSGSGSSSVASSPSANMIDMMLVAHGTIAAVAMLVLFPVGAIAVRISALGTWAHAGIQICSYLVFVAAAGLGIYLAKYYDLLKNKHPIIGMTLLGVLFLQPLFGLVHHRAYKKTQGRTITSYIHVWVGRLAVLLGMINGGLGIQLAGNISRGYIIAYGVVAGVMGVAFVANIVYGEMQVSRRSSDRSRDKREEGRNTS